MQDACIWIQSGQRNTVLTTLEIIPVLCTEQTPEGHAVRFVFITIASACQIFEINCIDFSGCQIPSLCLHQHMALPYSMIAIWLQDKNLIKRVWLQVLTAASNKNRAFWDKTPRSLVGLDRRFRGAYCLRHQDYSSFWNVGLYLLDYTLYNRNDGGSTHLWNVGLLRDCTALYLRKISSSY
jgi:hypothetical protein